MQLYSIGHSNRPLSEFLSLLHAAQIRNLADVRSHPGSRRWPHFNREALDAALADAGIRYLWIPDLGGRRRRQHAESRHSAWTVDAFRNYADYADTAEFAAGLATLLELASANPTAFMCAEALYWQCHRRLIADHLLVRGHEVLHLTGRSQPEPHRLPPFARVIDGEIVYDGGVQLELRR
jgi:uncharacterized protein (DUF488 family)